MLLVFMVPTHAPALAGGADDLYERPTDSLKAPRLRREQRAHHLGERDDSEVRAELGSTGAGQQDADEVGAIGDGQV
jgi:hypothetical protein